VEDIRALADETGFTLSDDQLKNLAGGLVSPDMNEGLLCVRLNPAPNPLNCISKRR